MVSKGVAMCIHKHMWVQLGTTSMVPGQNQSMVFYICETL